MSDQPASEAEEKPAAPVYPRIAERHPPRWHRLRGRLMELVIVFVGVYAAFLLNRLDSDRRDARRRAQILAAIERETATTVEELKRDIREAQLTFIRFDRRLALGRMPNLAIVYNNNGYSASDDATLLQAGGLELLDIQTIDLLRTANSQQRSLMSSMHNQFELGLTELANHPNADFYDPGTRQLRKPYWWYFYVQHSLLADARELLAAEEALLAHIRAESGDGSPAVERPR